jgi:hypothetical protein
MGMALIFNLICWSLFSKINRRKRQHFVWIVSNHTEKLHFLGIEQLCRTLLLLLSNCLWVMARSSNNDAAIRTRCMFDCTLWSRLPVDTTMRRMMVIKIIFLNYGSLASTDSEKYLKKYPETQGWPYSLAFDPSVELPIFSACYEYEKIYFAQHITVGRIILNLRVCICPLENICWLL